MSPADRRLEELLADRALGWLSDSEANELRELGHETALDGAPDDLEIAAAAALNAFATPAVAMPDHIRRSLERAAAALIGPDGSNDS